MRRLRSQEGFTLPELLVTMTLSMVTLLAAFALLDTVMKRTSDTQLRVEATQRGRQALDVMTRQLRSQVCLPNAITAPAVVSATPTSVTFYTDLTTGNGGPQTRIEKRTLAYDATTRRMIESIVRPGGSATAISHTGAPSTRELLANVRPVDGVSMFRYYAFTTTTPPTPTLELVNPGAADLGRIARIELAFTMTGGSGAKGAHSIELHDQVYVRAADPNDPAPYPTCA
jgi:Tfp pilus assembly protein PilV